MKLPHFFRSFIRQGLERDCQSLPKTSNEMPLRRILDAALGTALLTPTIVLAASFDCALAKTPQEELICMDYRLSELDSQLALLYRNVYAKSASEASKKKQEQARWLESRNRCASFSCVMSSYVVRIRELDKYTQPRHQEKISVDMPWDRTPSAGRKFVGGIYLSRDGQMLLEQHPQGGGNKYVLKEYLSGEEVPERQKSRRAPFVGNGVALKGVRLETGTIYRECSDLGSSGMTVSSAGATTRKLLFLKRGSYVQYRANTECEETELAVEPIYTGNFSVVNDTLYAFDEDFVVRFDHDLGTASKILGDRLFVAWSTDVEALVGNECDRQVRAGRISLSQYYQCVDRKLNALIEVVRKFY